MAELTEKSRALLRQPNIGYLATLMEDGSPHVSPVWVDVDDGRILVNTAVGRLKEENVRRDPRVALSIANGADPDDKVDIRGRVVEVIEGEQAVRHIHALSKKYTGVEPYPLREGEQRVLLVIEPLAVHPSR